MTSNRSLTLDIDDIDHKWKVTDFDKVLSDGKTIKEAIQSARLVTDKSIYHYEANKLYVNNEETIRNNENFYTLDELIRELSRFAEVHVTKVMDND